jgi:DinB superfamily
MSADQTASLREHLIYLLKGGGAHVNFDKAIAGLPPELRGAKAPSVPHTPWRLLEHMRIAQWDILEFTRNPKHVSPPWPEGYWPAGDAPPDAGAWDRSVAAFRADLRAMQDLVAAPSTDLFAPLPHGEGQTPLREALLIADHNAYHLGQLVVVRRLLGAWREEG